MNFSGHKLIINKSRFCHSIKKEKSDKVRCNHCGGLVRMDGELASCIMCSRPKEHLCDQCSYNPCELDNKKKKIA